MSSWHTLPLALTSILVCLARFAAPDSAFSTFTGVPIAIRSLIGPEHPGLPGKCIGTSDTGNMGATVRLGYCGATVTSTGARLGYANQLFTITSTADGQAWQMLSSSGLCVNGRRLVLETCSSSSADQMFVFTIAMWTSNGTYPIVSINAVGAQLQFQALVNDSIVTAPCSNSSLAQLFQVGNPVISTVPSSSYTTAGGLVCYASDQAVVLHWTSPSTVQHTLFTVMRRLSNAPGAPFQQIGTVSGRYGLNYYDSSVALDKSYDYRIATGNWIGPTCTAAARANVLEDDDAFLDYLQRTAFDYFWFQAHPRTGLVRDRNEPWANADVMATGFGLTAMAIGADRGYISRRDAADRVLTTLMTLRKGTQSPAASNVSGYNGFFYHRLDPDTGYRAENCELSPYVTAVLMSGVLYVKQFFTLPNEAAISGNATALFNAVNWTFFQEPDHRLGYQWYPDTGMDAYEYHGLSEAKLLYIMAIGSQTHPIPPTFWSAYTSTYTAAAQYGYSFIESSPLFTHQSSELYFDFRRVADLSGTVNYFENSRIATLTQQRYSMDKKASYAWHSEHFWGISDCDGPGNGSASTSGPNGVYYGYTTRGAIPALNDDNTVTPEGPAGSFMFTPTISLDALRYMYKTYCNVSCVSYGLSDAINPNWPGTWASPDVVGSHQGHLLLSLENQRTAGRIWSSFMQNTEMATAFQRIPSLRISNVTEFNLYLASIRPGKRAPLRTLTSGNLSSSTCLTRTSVPSGPIGFAPCLSYLATTTVESVPLTGGTMQQVYIRQWGTDFYILQLGPDFSMCIDVPRAASTIGLQLQSYRCDLVGFPSGSQWFRIKVVGADQDDVPIINLIQYDSGLCLESSSNHSGPVALRQQTCIPHRLQQMFVYGSTVSAPAATCPIHPQRLSTTARTRQPTPPSQRGLSGTGTRKFRIPSTQTSTALGYQTRHMTPTTLNIGNTGAFTTSARATSTLIPTPVPSVSYPSSISARSSTDAGLSVLTSPLFLVLATTSLVIVAVVVVVYVCTRPTIQIRFVPVHVTTPHPSQLPAYPAMPPQPPSPILLPLHGRQIPTSTSPSGINTSIQSSVKRSSKMRYRRDVAVDKFNQGAMTMSTSESDCD